MIMSNNIFKPSFTALSLMGAQFDLSNLDFGSVGEKHFGRKAKIGFFGTKVQIINLVCGCE